MDNAKRKRVEYARRHHRSNGGTETTASLARMFNVSERTIRKWVAGEIAHDPNYRPLGKMKLTADAISNLRALGLPTEIIAYAWGVTPKTIYNIETEAITNG